MSNSGAGSTTSQTAPSRRQYSRRRTVFFPRPAPTSTIRRGLAASSTGSTTFFHRRCTPGVVCNLLAGCRENRVSRAARLVHRRRSFRRPRPGREPRLGSADATARGRFRLADRRARLLGGAVAAPPVDRRGHRGPPTNPAVLTGRMVRFLAVGDLSGFLRMVAAAEALRPLRRRDGPSGAAAAPPPVAVRARSPAVASPRGRGGG